MHRREVRLAFSMLLGLGLAGGVVGCEEEFSDEKFGTLDLAPVYDGGTASNPAAGIPQEIRGQPGYLDGQVAEYYDFGLVPSIIDPDDGTPIAVRVQPMYFFFDRRAGRCSPPRCASCATAPTGSRAGTTCSTRTPRTSAPAGRGSTACKERNDEEKKKSYPLRRRDPLRRSRTAAVGRLPAAARSISRPQDNDPPRRQYTGLWEIVEVTAPEDYDARLDQVRGDAGKGGGVGQVQARGPPAR